MTTSEKLREELAKKGITNGRKLAVHLGSKGMIFFIRGEGSWQSARAELRFRENGVEQTWTYRPKGPGAVRQQCVEDAMAEGSERLGVESWSKTPFSNCWLPSDDVSRVHEEFDHFEDSAA